MLPKRKEKNKRHQFRAMRREQNFYRLTWFVIFCGAVFGTLLGEFIKR
jgi:hypothetical protein